MATQVSYIDENGATKTITSFNLVSDSTNAVTWSGSSKGGYYVVGADYNGDGKIDAEDAKVAGKKTAFTIKNTAIVSGDVKLILVDGFSLNVDASGLDEKAGIHVNTNDATNKFTVYAQANGSGALTATGGTLGAGIGSGGESEGANITITGGSVTAIGGFYGAGIGGGAYDPGHDITITGGVVTAKAGEGYDIFGAAGIGGGAGTGPNDGDGYNITISGGIVTAIGSTGGSGVGGGSYSIGHDIAITGGTVTATGGTYAAGIGDGSITHHKTGEYNISITGGVVIAQGGEGYQDAWTTIIPAAIGVGDNSSCSISGITVGPGLCVRAGGNNPPTTVIANDGSDLTQALFQQRYARITLSLVSYVDENGAIQTVESYNLITDSTGAVTWDGNSNGGYYVVGADYNGDGKIDAEDAKVDGKQTAFTIGDMATVSGDVKLILVDGFSLSVTGGNSGEAGICVSGNTNKFTVYAQATGSGALTAIGKGYGAGIGGSYGKTGSNITIAGGVVNATGGNGGGAGIGGAYCQTGSNITITGGTVLATGAEKAAGIGNGAYYGVWGSELNIMITGGTVIASGGRDAQGIGNAGAGAGSYNVTISTDMIVKSDDATPPTTVIENDGTDIIEKLGQYVIAAEKTAASVAYIDENGATQTVKSYNLIADSTGAVTWDGALKDGYYVVGADYNGDGKIDAEDAKVAGKQTAFTISNTVNISGNVKLILADGFSLTVDASALTADGIAGIHVSGSNSLSIYAQTGDSGALTASSGNRGAGIGGNLKEVNGAININGGVVFASGTWGAGIGGGSDATGKNININGGTVTAVTVSTAWNAMAIGSGSSGGNASNLFVKNDIAVKAGSSAEDAVAVTPDTNDDYASAFSGKGYVSTVAPEASGMTPVEYIKANGKTAYVGGRVGGKYTLINGDNLPQEWTAGTYVVGADYNGDGKIDAEDAEVDGIQTAFTITGGAIVSGAVRLIIVDGFSLTVDASSVEYSAGIEVSGDGNSLEVFAQSNDSGKLFVTGGAGGAGIGGNSGAKGNNIALYGGTISITGGTGASAVGGGAGATGTDIVAALSRQVQAGSSSESLTTLTNVGWDMSNQLQGQNVAVITKSTEEIHTERIIVTEDVSFDGRYTVDAGGNGGAVAFSNGAHTITLADKVTFIQSKTTGAGGVFAAYGNTNVQGAGSSVNFVGNHAGTFGGVIDIYNSNVTLTGVFAAGNSGGQGGVFANNGTSELTVIGGTFLNNYASGNGGFLTDFDTNAKAVLKGDSSSKLIISGNTAGDRGGAIFDNGAVSIEIENAVFSGNVAKDAGAIQASQAASLRIQDADFVGNKTETYGGAIDSYRTNLTLEYTKDGSISDNSGANGGGLLLNNDSNYYANITTNGGTLTFANNSATANGGAIYFMSGTSSLAATGTGAVVFSGNTAVEKGGAIYNKGVVTISAKTEFSGNAAASGGAVENEGTLIMANTLTLGTSSDTFVNKGTLNWDLSAGTTAYGALGGYQYLSNSGDNAKLTITVNAAEKLGTVYTIATGNFSTLTGKETFTLVGSDSTADITVNGAVVNFNGIDYQLKTDGSGDSAKLLLCAGKGFLVSVDTPEKWFKQNETVTLNGTVTFEESIGLESLTLTGVGDSAIALTWDSNGKWSYTYTGDDTEATELTITATNTKGETAVATYTLKVDTVLPEISYEATAGYDKDGVRWYKQDASAVLTVDAEDETSGVATLLVDGSACTPGTSQSLNTGAEMQTAQTIQIVATDNAGNQQTDATFSYNVDGTEPEFTEVEITSANLYNTGNGYWVKQGDTTTVKTTVSDSRSGVNADSVKFDDKAYTSGNAVEVDASAECDLTTHTFSAADNVANTASKQVKIGVDGTGPEVTIIDVQSDNKYVSGDTIWFKQNDVTVLKADISDAKSGLKSATYNGVAYVNGQFVIDTTSEVDVAAQNIIATDNVNNVNNAVQVQAYGVDGTGPEVANVEFQATTKYVDGNGKVWFQQNDNSAVLAAKISDARSGLKSATYNGVAYVNGQFVIDTTSEVDVAAQNIVATDNVNNVNNAVQVQAYGVDGTGPEVTNIDVQSDNMYVSGGTIWFKQNDVTVLTAKISDDKSGLKSATYNGVAYDVAKGQFAIDTTAEVNVDAQKIIATDNVGNVNNTRGLKAYGVDGTGPEVANVEFQATTKYVDGDGKVWFKQNDTSAVLAAKISDARSGLKSATYNGVAYVNGQFVIDTAHEIDVDVKNIVATDNVNNVNDAVKAQAYGVDGTEPEVTNVEFQATTKYVDDTGKVWFQQGDSTAKLVADITDSKSGLKSATYNGFTYADGKFVIDTTAEVDVTVQNIVATDNVGNVNQDYQLQAYGVDGTGPTITVSQNPGKEVYTDVITVTAGFSDAGSGMATQQYAINGGAFADYTGSLRITENCTITFRATDKVGNVSTLDYAVTTIDPFPPVITITADTTTIVNKLTFTANATDEHSGVKSFAYSTDNGATWIDYVNDAPITVRDKGTYLFRAIDKAKNEAYESVTFNNVYPKSKMEDEVSVDHEKQVIEATTPVVSKKVALANDSELTVAENASLTAENVLVDDSLLQIEDAGNFSADEVTFRNGTLNVAESAAANAGKMVVESGTNALNGFVDMNADSVVQVAQAATLALDKNQFDEFMSTRRFQSDGKLEVAAVEGNELTEANVKQLINANTVREVNFAQDLNGIHDLVFTENNALNIGFQDGYGTAKSDRVVAKANSTLVLGTADYTLDLAEGKNAFYVRNNADVTLNSKLLNVTELTVNSGNKQSAGGVKTQGYTNAKFANIEFADKYNAAFTVGKFAVVNTGAVNGYAKSDKLTVGSNSSATFGEVTGFESIAVSAGSKYTPASGEAKVQGTTVANFASITAGEKLALTTGSYSVVTAGNVDGSDKADKLTVGKLAAFGANSIALSDGDDKVTVSAKASVMVANFSMGVGKDTLSVGDDANMNVSGLTQFDSDDSVTVGKNAVVVFKALAPDDGSAITLKKFTLGKNAEAYLSTELVGAVTKTDKTAQVFDIGDSNVAMSFTDIETETADDVFEKAGDLSEDYNGWLNSSLDVADFFEIGSADELTWQADSGLEVKLYDENGVGTLVTGGTAVTTGYKAFAVSVADGEAEKKSYWYTAKLA